MGDSALSVAWWVRLPCAPATRPRGGRKREEARSQQGRASVCAARRVGCDTSDRSVNLQVAGRCGQGDGLERRVRRNGLLEGGIGSAVDLVDSDARLAAVLDDDADEPADLEDALRPGAADDGAGEV